MASLPSGVAGLDSGGWLALWVNSKDDAPDLSVTQGRTQGAITDYFRGMVQDDTSWQSASLTFFTNILHGFQDLGNFLTLITNAVTGAPGGLSDLTSFLNDRWNDLADAFEKAIDSIAGLKWLRDTLTGITNAVDSDVLTWVSDLLTAASNLDAAKVIGLLASAVIPGLDASKIISGQFATSMITGLQSWFDGIAGKAGAVVSDVVARLQHLATNGLFDATKLFGTLLASFIPGLDASKVTTGSFAQTMVNGLISDLGSILTGVKTGADGTGTGTSGTIADQIGQARDSLLGLLGLSQDALKSAIAAQTTLQEQEGEQNTGGGSSYSFVFSGVDGAALNSTDWTTGPTAGDVTIRGDSGYAGVKNGNGDGHYFASPNYQYATDGQSASFVLGDTQNGNYYSGVYIRCDSARATGAYCLAKAGEIRIGKFVRSGTSWTFQTPLTLQTSLSSVKQGARIEFRCSGNNYYVRVNGQQMLLATDASNTISIGTDYRYSMLTVQRATPFFTYDSYRIASFAMSDYASSGGGISLTNSWLVSRSSTTFVSITATYRDKFPSGFFTFSDYANGATVSDLGTGRITVAESGLYKVSTTFSGSASGYVVPHSVIYRNGNPVTGPIAPGVDYEILLAAGDTVQPGFFAVDYDVRSNGSTGSEVIKNRQIDGLAGYATFSGRRIV